MRVSFPTVSKLEHRFTISVFRRIDNNATFPWLSTALKLLKDSSRVESHGPSKFPDSRPTLFLLVDLLGFLRDKA